MELKPTAEEYHLPLVWRRKSGDPQAEAKKTLEKRASRKVVEEVAKGDEKSSSSSEFDCL